MPALLTALVLLLPLVVFAPSMSNGFAMDDAPLASGESILNPGQPDPVIGELRGPEFYFDKFYWFAEYVNDGLYRPVTIYSYALVYALVGKHVDRAAEAVPQHVVNVLLHVWATLLVLLLLSRIGLSSLAAHVGAGLFGVHAIHSEVVAGVVGRAELLAFCFGIAGILLFLRSLASAAGKRFGLLIGSAALFFLAYGSKESALASCPFLICVVLARGERGAALGTAALVSVLPLALFLLLRQSVVSSYPRTELIDYVANPLYQADLTTRLATAVKVLGYGLYKCVAPLHLSANYSPAVFSLEPSFFGVRVLAAIAGLGGLLFVGLRYARRVPALFLAVACFFGFSFVTSNLPFAIGTVFAERLYYTPSLGVCVLAALLVERFGGHRVLIGGLIVWAMVSAGVAWQRNGVWHDTETLFLHEAENQPRSADMLVKAAGVLRRRLQQNPNDPVAAAGAARALGYADSAIQLIAAFPYPHALREKAAIFTAREEWDAALLAYDAALQSDYPELDDAKVRALNGMASIWLARRDGKQDKANAVEYAERAIGIGPRDSTAWLVLAEFGPGIVPAAKMRGYFTAGRDAWQASEEISQAVGRPGTAMYLGVMGEKAGADPKAVFELLNFGVKHVSPSYRGAPIFVESIFSMGKAKARSGEPAVARDFFDGLLKNQTLPEELRRRIRTARDKLPRR